MSMYFQIYLNDKQFGNFNTEFKSMVEKQNSGVGVEIICANFGEDYKNVSVQKHPVSKNWKKV